MKYPKLFYEDTGMYTDWDQLKHLPPIDTLIDIGVAPEGTPELYELFNDANLILIDPLYESEKYAKENLTQRGYKFFETAVGSENKKMKMNIFSETGLSSLLETSKINFTDEPIEKRLVDVTTLDELLRNEKGLGNLGIKLDTEGYELEAIKGAGEILKKTKFVLSETRHNHESLMNVYKLHEFVNEMHKNDFILTKIITAKPFIADLVFQPLWEADQFN